MSKLLNIHKGEIDIATVLVMFNNLMNLIIPTAMSLCLTIIKCLLKNIQMILYLESSQYFFFFINISGGSRPTAISFFGILQLITYFDILIKLQKPFNQLKRA